MRWNDDSVEQNSADWAISYSSSGKKVRISKLLHVVKTCVGKTSDNSNYNFFCNVCCPPGKVNQ